MKQKIEKATRFENLICIDQGLIGNVLLIMRKLIRHEFQDLLLARF